MSVLELDRVTYRYPGSARPALDGVTVRIEPGELVVLVGISGSGKSTLLCTASGLVPHFHGGEFAGRAVVAGLDTRDHGPGELAVAVGTLFQDPETQVLMGTPRAELAFPLENRGESAGAVARAVEEASLALGIAHLLDRSTSELSGGELQRVALGAALVGRPALVVLDEPTANLAPIIAHTVLQEHVRQLAATGASVLIVEQRARAVLEISDRTYVLGGGRLQMEGTPEELSSSPEFIESFLGGGQRAA